MQVSDDTKTALLQKWNEAKDWRDLLRLTARCIRDEDLVTPLLNKSLYSTSRPALTNALKTDMLRFQEYGFLVRIAQPAHDSGPLQNTETKGWKRTSSRAVHHCILPTKPAVSTVKIKELLNKLVEDRTNIEMTVLGDYKDYPRTSNLGIGFCKQYAQPPG